MTKCRLNEKDRADILLEHDGASAREHFVQCPSCSEAFARQVALWKVLDGWEMPDVSSGFNRGLYAKIDAAATAPWYETWVAAVKPFFAQPSFGLAAAAAVMVTGFLFDHQTRVVRPAETANILTVSHSAVQVSSTEAEQVEKTLEDLEMLHTFDTGNEEKDSATKAM